MNVYVIYAILCIYIIYIYTYIQQMINPIFLQPASVARTMDPGV